MTELPENLKGFEGLFYPADYVSPKKSVADTLILERPPLAESYAARVRQLGRNMLRGIWRSPRARRYGLGLSLGSTAIATGIAVAFLTPNHETAQAQPPETLIIMPSDSTHPSQKSQKSSRIAPVGDPSDISTLFPSWTDEPKTWRVAPSSSAPSISASPKVSAKPITPQPVAPSPSWSTMYPTGAPSPETVPTTTATDTPPSDTPTMPLQTPESTTSGIPETLPASVLPQPGG